MILESKDQIFTDFKTDSFITQKRLLKLLEKRNEFREELKDLYSIDESKTTIIQIGNAKFLIDALIDLDNRCEKIDTLVHFKDIYLEKMLKDEKAIFQIYNLTEELSKVLKKDSIQVETRYDAKSDILDFYNFSKFANFLRDNSFDELIFNIRDYIQKNFDNNASIKLRIIHSLVDNNYYLRAVTSDEYKDFGINFSAFIALMVLDKYVRDSKNEIFINSFRVDDSTFYASFELKNDVKINEHIDIAINLILENDELKRNAVSFNGVFKLKYRNQEGQSEIYLKPKGLNKEGNNEPVDLLTFHHRGSVANVLEKIKELEIVISSFIQQVSDDAITISKISHPDDIRKHLGNKVKFARKIEFQAYKERIYQKLMSITVDTTFQLFALLRQVDELFEHTDIVSRDFWRTKLYEMLTKR